MKKTWFHGLALSLGITTFPSVVNAQTYNPGGGGLAPSSFQLPPLPSQQQYAPQQQPQQQYVPQQYVPTQQAAQPSPFGQVPQAAPGYPVAQSRVPAVQVAYSQHGASIGSGAVEQYSHVPLPPPGHGPAPTVPQTYESAPSVNAAPSSNGCASCATGNCSVHGGGYSYGGGYGYGSPGPVYGVGSTPYGYGGYGESYGDSCGESVSCAPSVVSPSPWIFGAGGLVMNRIDDSNVRLSSDGNMPTDGLLYTQDAKMRTSGGFQGSVGRYFGGGRYALVGTYWGIYPQYQQRYITAGAGQDLTSDLPWTIQNFGGAGPMPVGVPRGIDHPTRNGFNWYDMAEAHMLTRHSEFHNVELNLYTFALGGAARAGDLGCGTGGGCGTGCGTGPTGPCAPWYGAQCSKLRFNLFGGIRWFRFQDNLEYATNQGDYNFNRSGDDFYYNNDVINDLIGFQLGSIGNLCLGSRFNLYGSTAFGIYNNRISADTHAGTDMQVANIASNNAWNGTPYSFMNTQNDVAFLGEGNCGVGVRVFRGWTANVGYRVVAVSGVATAVGQIPYDFSNGEEVNRIRNDRSLILHGGVFGVNYNF